MNTTQKVESLVKGTSVAHFLEDEREVFIFEMWDGGFSLVVLEDEKLLLNQCETFDTLSCLKDKLQRVHKIFSTDEHLNLLSRPSQS